MSNTQNQLHDAHVQQITSDILSNMSDIYKDIYGYRLRGNQYDDMSVSELLEEERKLYIAAEASFREEELYAQAQAIQVMNTIDGLSEQHGIPKGRALKWLLEAENPEGIVSSMDVVVSDFVWSNRLPPKYVQIFIEMLKEA